MFIDHVDMKQINVVTKGRLEITRLMKNEKVTLLKIKIRSFPMRTERLCT